MGIVATDESRVELDLVPGRESPRVVPGESRPETALISVVVPAYNEEGCAAELVKRLRAVFDSAPGDNFEALIVDNGSSDRTLEVLREAIQSDSRFTILQMSKPFGADNGMSAGLAMSKGDAVVIMVADLQDPPEMIPTFMDLWRDGYDNIYGVVRSRPDTGIVRRFFSQIYYNLASRLSRESVPKNASDFRLIDRVVVDAVVAMPERNRFLRSLISWTGFRSVGVAFNRDPRFAGESHASREIWWVVRNAIDSLLSLSDSLLNAIPIAGFALSLLSILGFLGMSVNWLFNGVPFPGFGTLLSAQLLLFGLTFLFLGLISRYISLMYKEVQQRPNFIIRSVVRPTTETQSIEGE